MNLNWEKLPSVIYFCRWLGCKSEVRLYRRWSQRVRGHAGGERGWELKVCWWPMEVRLLWRWGRGEGLGAQAARGHRVDGVVVSKEGQKIIRGWNEWKWDNGRLTYGSRAGFFKKSYWKPQLAFRKWNGINSRRAGALSSLYRIVCEFQKDFPSWEKLSISSHHSSDEPHRLEWSSATARREETGRWEERGAPFLAEAARWREEAHWGWRWTQRAALRL